MTLRGQAIACLFERRARHPYYILAPPYSVSSAGNRALYVLCHALNGVGEEAYVVRPEAGEAPGAEEVEGLYTPRLEPTRARGHHQLGRTPVIICPETFTLPETDAVRCVYLLNYAGHLGGPERYDEADLTAAYSRNIARRTPGCDHVIHIPVVDASFWTPRGNAPRSGVAVYAGKYVDHHNQTLPDFGQHTQVITRFQTGSPTRHEMRDIFRAVKRLYIFENTAAAIEAALCGCPVVCVFNAFFDELISAEEIGLAGFALIDSPEAIAAAEHSVAAFRQGYEDASKSFGEALLAFVEHTQCLAAGRIYDRPFHV